MPHFTFRLALGLALTLVPAMPTPAVEDKEVVAARKEVLDLAKDVADGKDLTKKVAAMRKKYEDLLPIAHIYKHRTRGGIGFGPQRTGAIETKISDLSKRVLPPQVLQRESVELIRLGHINVAMAEITRAYFPEQLQPRLPKKQWEKDTDDMKKAARDLIRAVHVRDPAALKRAANDLHTACLNCHCRGQDDR